MMIAFIERFIIAFERLAAAQQEIARKTPEPTTYFVASVPGSNVAPYFPPGHTQISTAPPEPSAGGSY
jgi:hypothetical protein